jgi:hypothetical protein
MTAAVVRDDPEAPLSEEEHLRVPRIAVERPAMGENHRLSLPNPFSKS